MYYTIVFYMETRTYMHNNYAMHIGSRQYLKRKSKLGCVSSFTKTVGPAKCKKFKAKSDLKNDCIDKKTIIICIHDRFMLSEVSTCWLQIHAVGLLCN